MRLGLAIFMLLVVLRLFVGCGQNTERHGIPPTPNSGENQKPEVPGEPSKPPEEPLPSPLPPIPQPPPVPPPPSENPLELSFKNISKRVFSVSCYSCHSRKLENTQGQLGLDVYSEVKDSSARIYIETIITRRMPLQGTLTQEQIELLKAWLEADAPEEQPAGLEFSVYRGNQKKE